MAAGTFDIIDKRVANLTRGLDGVEKQLFIELEKLILSIDSLGGRFKQDKTAFQVLSSLKPKLAEIVKQSDYSKRIFEFVDSFDEINDNIKRLHKDFNQASIPEVLLKTEKAGFIRETVATLNDAQINSAFSETIRKVLFQRVNLGAGVGDTLSTIREMVQGSDGNLGILTRWSGQVARDALGQYQGNVNAKIQQEFDFAGYIYIGTLVDDSRPQCERWLNKGFIPISELNKELSWAHRNGSGMVKVTTSDTFAVYRGGYNCRHEAIPTNGPIDSAGTKPKKQSKPNSKAQKRSGKGEPVSKAFGTIDKGVEVYVNQALSDIDNIHSDGKLPQIPIVKARSGNANGYYKRKLPDFAPVEIGVKANIESPELTLYHEIGHFIDNKGFKAQKDFESHQANGLLSGVISKINETENIQTLRQWRENGFATIEGKRFRLGSDHKRHIDYLTSNHEMWARAYAQYIAQNSGNKSALKQLDENNRPEVFLSQWSKKAFEPINKEIDKVFKKMGWIR